MIQGHKDRTLVILAGGQSSRMGRDKTFLPYKDTTFLEHLVREAKPYFSNIFVSAGSREHALLIRRQLEDPQAGDPPEIPSDHIVTDLYDRIGPMGGILSVFETIRPESFVLLAVDIPEADMQVLAVLADLAGHYPEAALMLRLTGSERVFPCSPGKDLSSGSGKASKGAEACAAVYNRKAHRLMKAAYEQGEYSLRKALGDDQIRCIGVSALRPYLPDIREEDLRQAFCNVNTPQEYERACPDTSFS